MDPRITLKHFPEKCCKGPSKNYVKQISVTFAPSSYVMKRLCYVSDHGFTPSSSRSNFSVTQDHFTYAQKHIYTHALIQRNSLESKEINKEKKRQLLRIASVSFWALISTSMQKVQHNVIQS